MRLFEVFDDLQVNEELAVTFNETEVEKVTVLRKSGTVVVHIDSKKLIPKQSIKKMQKELKKQCFANTEGALVFREHYRLSGQYHLENLWDAYKDSILEELSDESIMLAAFLKKAALSFTEREIKITAEDSFLNRHSGEELKDYLETLFLERFDMEAIVRVVYEKKEAERKQAGQEQAYEFLNRDVLRAFGVKRALENASEGGQSNKKSAATVKTEKSAADKVSAKAAMSGQTASKQEQTAGGQAEKAKSVESQESKKPEGKREFVPKKKIPDDPDIFYGRPFEGEATPLADIQDEIGECVVRGKVIKFEDRPLKNNPEKFFVSAYITDFTDTIGVKLFVKMEDIEELRSNLKKGKYVKLKGLAALDRYDHEVSISAVVGDEGWYPGKPCCLPGSRYPC